VVRFISLTERNLLLFAVVAFSILSARTRGAGPLSIDTTAVTLLQASVPLDSILDAVLMKARTLVWIMLPGVVILALVLRQWSAAVLPVLSMAVVWLGDALKPVMDRPHPPSHLILLSADPPAPMGSSFPSGTGVMGIMLMVISLYVLWHWLKEKPAYRRRQAFIAGIFFWSVLNLLTLFSVVYARHHWFSDVVGGWLWAAIFVPLFLGAHRWWLDRQGDRTVAIPWPSGERLRWGGIAALTGGVLALMIPPFMGIAMCQDWGGSYTIGSSCGGPVVRLLGYALAEAVPPGSYQKFGMMYMGVYALILTGALTLRFLTLPSPGRSLTTVGFKLVQVGLVMNLFGNFGDYWLGERVLGQPWWGLSFGIGTILGLLVYWVGTILAGIGSIRSGSLPRPASWVLAIGPVAGIPFSLLVHNLPSGPTTASGLTWIILGIAMLRPSSFTDANSRQVTV
jgi:membrane-associated phospholipid phosphatase